MGGRGRRTKIRALNSQTAGERDVGQSLTTHHSRWREWAAANPFKRRKMKSNGWQPDKRRQAGRQANGQAERFAKDPESSAGAAATARGTAVPGKALCRVT